MASFNLTQPAPIAQNSRTTIVLSTGEWATVPEGADPDAYRRYCEARIKLAANPRKRQRAYVRSSKPSRKINYAERVLAATPFNAGMEAVATRLDELKAENIKVVCAWCKCHMRGAKDASIVSHGICDFCFAQQVEPEPTFVSGIEWDLPFMGEPVACESEADDYGLEPAW